MKKAVFVILDHFADWEPAFLANALSGDWVEGWQSLYASNDKDIKRSIGGLTVLPDISLNEVPFDAEALIFIGADGSWRQEQAEAAKLARAFYEQGKVVAGICDAARWLGSIGLLNDRQHTLNSPTELKDESAYTNQEGYLEQEAVRDGNVVTANGNAPAAFAAEVLRALNALPEDSIAEYLDFFTIGYHKALKKYGYV